MNGRNILLITSMYPLLDSNYEGTKVCHYFASEWQKLGYNVRVIRLTTYFPRIAYVLAKLFKEKIKAKTGAVVYTERKSKYERYKLDGVSVMLAPMYKYVPHIVPSEKRLNKILKQPLEDLVKEGFVPDYITAHFQNPQLRAISLAKQIFKSAQCCMVMHNNGYELGKLYGKDLNKYMNNIDVWGFRSYAFRNEFEEKYGRQARTFICTSGIPEEYISEEYKKIDHKISRFVFLGSLFELKRVKDSITALAKAYPEKDFKFDIIGDGAEMDSLKKLAKSLDVEKQVIFHGRKSRDEAQKIVAAADVFVMVSAHEAFGLVYIEAMSKGCITIGTRGQGIDGVIKHGENGFLCESCNPDALCNLIKNIKNMSLDELNDISRKALDTAKTMTNRNVALSYINSISHHEY